MIAECLHYDIEISYGDVTVCITYVRVLCYITCVLRRIHTYMHIHTYIHAYMLRTYIHEAVLPIVPMARVRDAKIPHLHIKP